MEIRFAKEHEASQVIQLCKLHAEFEKATFDIENKQELFMKYFLNEESQLKCLVAVEKERVIGYATFMKQFSTWDMNYYIYLDCLFFVKEARGRSLGTKMMNEIKECAEKEGCKEIQWQTPSFNKRAVQFYQKIGAEFKNKERFFWPV